MKKAVVGLILATALVITACGGKKAPVNQQQVTTYQPSDEELQEMLEIAQEIEAENTPSQQQQPVAPEQQPVEPVQPVEDTSDPWYGLRADRSVVSDGFFLKHNDILYTIGNIVPGRFEVTHYGRQYYPNVLWLFHHENGKNREMYLCSYGNVPLLEFSPGDEIIAYNQSGIPILFLCKVEPVGYTIGMVKDSKEYYAICNFQTGTEQAIFKRDGWPTVLDSAGNDVTENIFNLNFGEEYIIPFNEGTMAREIRSVADSQAYRFVNPRVVNAGDYEIPGIATPEGYATYDVSSVPPGIYETSWGLIKIP